MDYLLKLHTYTVTQQLYILLRRSEYLCPHKGMYTNIQSSYSQHRQENANNLNVHQEADG